MDEPWRIGLLGGLRVEREGQVITRFRTQKTGALLARLAFYHQRIQTREELIELLWPGCDPKLGRRSLRVALTSLRHQLEPPGVPTGAVIYSDRAAVQLNLVATVTDVAEFEAALQAAGRAQGSVEQTPRLAEAVELYGGELLPGYVEE